MSVDRIWSVLLRRISEDPKKEAEAFDVLLGIPSETVCLNEHEKNAVISLRSQIQGTPGCLFILWKALWEFQADELDKWCQEMKKQGAAKKQNDQRP
jgi:hypothetical protein